SASIPAANRWPPSRRRSIAMARSRRGRPRRPPPAPPRGWGGPGAPPPPPPPRPPPPSKASPAPAAGRRARGSAPAPPRRRRRRVERAGLQIGDMEVVELNEAFAAQVLACVRDLRIDLGRLNPDGGALALGHPLGASGARITGKAAALLKRTGGRHALATMCIGGGQGIATVLEAIR